MTGVQPTALSLGSLHNSSVEQRMAWASNRTTTRKEDIGYCLLGMFDVHIPMLCGEGRKAFIRLQEEMIKRHADHFIFAWT
ncbi:uncharacterized protein A1O5_12979, partial [Cladophialophora psammophila CBS 110553]